MLSKVILLSLILTIIVAVIWFIRKWDKEEPEPFKHLLITFIAGCMLVLAERFIFRFFICKVFFNDDIYEFSVRITDEYSRFPDYTNYATLSRALFSAFIIGALLKEGIKFFGFEYACTKFRKDINEARDPIVYALVLALGFAVTDIAFHYYIDLLPYKIASSDLPGIRLNILWVTLRLLLVHLSSAIIMGIGYSLYKFHFDTRQVLGIKIPLFLLRNRKSFILVSLILAILNHGLVVFITVKRGWPGILLGITILVFISLFLVRLLKKFNHNPYAEYTSDY